MSFIFYLFLNDVIDRLNFSFFICIFSCGNLELDEGEECDCGKPGLCSNPCCNPLTCKFSRADVKCATGLCCDLSVNVESLLIEVLKLGFFFLIIRIVIGNWLECLVDRLMIKNVTCLNIVWVTGKNVQRICTASTEPNV